MAINKKGIFVTITAIVLLLVLLTAFSTYTKQTQDIKMASERIKTNTMNSFARDINNHLVPGSFKMTIEKKGLTNFASLKAGTVTENEFKTYIQGLLETNPISIKHTIADTSNIDLTFSNYNIIFTIPTETCNVDGVINFDVDYLMEDKEKTLSWTNRLSFTKILPAPQCSP